MTDRATTNRTVRIKLRSGMRDGDPMAYSLTSDESEHMLLDMDSHADLDPGTAYDTWIDVTITAKGVITSAVANSEPPTRIEYEPDEDEDDDNPFDMPDVPADEIKASGS